MYNEESYSTFARIQNTIVTKISVWKPDVVHSVIVSSHCQCVKARECVCVSSPPYTKYYTKASPNSSSVAVSANRKIYSNLHGNLCDAFLSALPCFLTFPQKYTCFIKYPVLFIENIAHLSDAHASFEKMKKHIGSFLSLVFPGKVRGGGESALRAQTQHHTRHKHRQGGATGRGQQRSISVETDTSQKPSATTNLQHGINNTAYTEDLLEISFYQ